MSTLSAITVRLCLLALLPLIVHAAEPATDLSLPPGADVIEVLFDQAQPVERGLTFDRAAVKPAQVELMGRKEAAWVAENSIEPSMRWIRSFLFKVTDPRFQKGGRQAIDVEITYHNPGLGSVRVKGDTTEGARLIGSQYGSTQEWRTLRFTLDDAFFGARIDAQDTKPALNGFDLRIDGINGPFYLKRVRLIGYDPKENVVWSRMLKTAAVTAEAPGGVFAFTQGPDRRINVTLQNLARVERPLHYRLQITGLDDQVRHQVEAKTTLAAGGVANLPLTFDTSKWPLGPYEGRLGLYLNERRERPAYTRTFRLGVISRTPLAKALPGEFLYGLDAANTTIYPILTPTAFAYYRLMGVDILRNPYNRGMKETVDDLGTALSLLAAEDVQTAVMVDPPKDTDAGKRATQLAAKVVFVEEVARRFTGSGPGKVRFYEMGNEPDLPHFYPAEISTYIDSFYAMRDAVKRGALAAGFTDADTLVMNGGLSFAGADGVRRAEEFVEKVDAAKIDAIAYHGHGAGISAERNAYERLERVAAKHGKANIPFVETESGFSGVDRVGQAEQARTVVEKMLYAQSKGAPLFMFFRLFMEGAGVEGGYSMTDHFAEPRASVLGYRNLVERLRHHRFQRTLDFDKGADADGITSFLFEERDAKGGVTGRKTLVAFCEKPVAYELRFGLDQDGASTGKASAYDLYGNALPVETTQGVATFTVGVDPVFVTWTSPGAATDARVMPALLTVDASQPLIPGAANPLVVVVRNPQPDKPLDVELSFIAQSRLPVKTEPAVRAITLPAGGSVNVPVTISLGQADRPLGLPSWWTVFTDIDAAALTPAQLSAIPAHLPGKDGGAPVSGVPTLATAGRLNFGRVAGGFGENRSGIAYAFIDAARAVELECGATGDWYMAWYLNGKKVQDTLSLGNGQHGTISLHAFTLPLMPGRNVLAVVVTSGRGGWDVQYGGPKELQIARQAGDDPDNLTIVMKSSDGRMLSRQKIAFAVRAAVPALGGVSSPEQWLQLEPLAVLGSDAVTNVWMKEPDSSRWHRGDKDLSAVTWLRDDGRRLHLFVAVTDDKLAEQDSLQLVIADEAGKSLLAVTGGLVEGRAVTTATAEGVEFKEERRETAGAAGVTFYHVSFPKAAVQGRPFRVNVQVTDDDAGYLKQVLKLGDVAEPAQGVRRLVE